MTDHRTPKAKHTRIAPEDLQLYISRKITSKELSERSGYNAVYLRKSIKRPPLTDRKNLRREEAQKLAQARANFRKEIAHLPVSEITKLANVSESTALRIKKKYRNV